MQPRCPSFRCARIAAASLAGLLMLAARPAAAAPACRADSPAHAVPVIELYTSEGCSSCPGADRWLSRLDPDAGLVALAFHVDYWDRLGWADRFASPRFTQRQAEQRISSGARFSYTPQVLLDGIDRKDWPGLGPGLAPHRRPLAPVAVTLARDGARFIATVRPLAGAPQHLAAYWAVTEQNHVSTVRAGENVGATLRHDHVVREYHPVAAWGTGSAQIATLEFKPETAADPAHPRLLTVVVVGAATGRPVQALGLGC